MGFEIAPLPGIGFGCEVSGLAPDRFEDPSVRQALADLWADKGIILFRGLDGSDTQIRLSEVFGEVQEHPLWRDVDYVPRETKLVIDVEYDPDGVDGDIYLVDGEERGGWLPWHYDGTYSSVINRGGIMRPVIIPDRGGQTGFLDKAAAYDSLSEELKVRIGDLYVLYVYEPDVSLARFGQKPDGTIRISEKFRKLAAAVTTRAAHPMVTVQAETGRRMLNVSPWFADGIEGMENEEGDAILRDVVAACIQPERAYFHDWRMGDMLLWDNWRMLHCATGVPRGLRRHMRRTTIMGGYALGRYETTPESPVPEFTM